jgi:hypothetical protein
MKVPPNRLVAVSSQGLKDCRNNGGSAQKTVTKNRAGVVPRRISRLSKSFCGARNNHTTRAFRRPLVPRLACRINHESRSKIHNVWVSGGRATASEAIPETMCNSHV